MIRLLSILLFGLLLYNTIGYAVVYLCESKNTVSSEKKNFIETDTYSQDIVIKIPLSIPYQTNWKSPETVDGMIQHNGNYYQMKTRQLINDTLYLHCEFDLNARERFTSLVSNMLDQIQGTQSDAAKSQHASVLKNLVKEYMAFGKKHTFYVLEWTENYLPVKDQYVLHSYQIHRRIQSPPPELS